MTPPDEGGGIDTIVWLRYPEHDRIAPDRVVSGKILSRHDPTATLHLTLDQLGSAAAVKAVFSFACNSAQRLGEIGLGQAGADTRRVAVDEECCRGRGIAYEARLVFLQRLRQPLMNNEAFGQRDGRLNQLMPWQRAKPHVRFPHSRD